MKNCCLIFLITAAAVLTAACQTFTDFVIVNQSGAKVEFSFERNSERALITPADLKNSRLRLIGLKEFESGSFEWRELPAERLQVDAETRTAKIEIESGEVLRFDLDSYDSPETYLPGSDFKIKKMTLSGVNGSITYEGANIYKQFERKTRGWFSTTGDYHVIAYR